MERDEITHMSYGCGKEAGNVLSWLVEKDKLKESFNTQKSYACNERSGRSREMVFKILKKLNFESGRQQSKDVAVTS